MKKIFLILPLMLILAIPVSAKNETNAQGTSGSQQGTTTQAQQQLRVSPSPIGTGVQNQNQVGTKNQGEDSQLLISTQEQENLEGSGEGMQTRSQAATQNMSIVAQKVQEMLQIRTTGGIGEQVRQIAKDQNQAQTQIQDEINKIDSRTGILKSLAGPDYKAIRSLKQQLEQNQLRIQQLNQLQDQLYSQVDITAVEETIKALTEENTSLQELINAEEQTRSLLGWLFRLFAR